MLPLPLPTCRTRREVNATFCMRSFFGVAATPAPFTFTPLLQLSILAQFERRTGAESLALAKPLASFSYSWQPQT